MPKTRAVIKKISKAAKDQGLNWELLRHGANHDVYAIDGLVIPIPRHTETDNRMAEVIYKECAPKLGEDWWK